MALVLFQQSPRTPVVASITWQLIGRLKDGALDEVADTEMFGDVAATSYANYYIAC